MYIVCVRGSSCVCRGNVSCFRPYSHVSEAVLYWIRLLDQVIGSSALRSFTGDASNWIITCCLKKKACVFFKYVALCNLNLNLSHNRTWKWTDVVVIVNSSFSWTKCLHGQRPYSYNDRWTHTDGSSFFSFVLEQWRSQIPFPHHPWQKKSQRDSLPLMQILCQRNLPGWL